MGDHTWTTSQSSHEKPETSSSLRWNTGEFSSTPRSVAVDTLGSSSTARREPNSWASTGTRKPWKRVGPTSPRIRTGFGSFVTTSRDSRPYWNDSGLRRFAESYSTLEFPHPNLMKRIEDSLSDQADPSTCVWTPPNLSRRQAS